MEINLSKIILVDDENAMEFIYFCQLEDYLNQYNIEFKYFDSAQAFLDYSNSDDFSSDSTIVFSDINMPGMDGISMTEILRKNFPELIIYLSSAYDQKDNEERIQKCHISGYLQKPVDFSHIERIIFNSTQTSAA